ncbi:MAG: diguanylate cyclase [Gallionella sp.]|jgi:diguanylate cyclase (GGDEF)-like protein/PAS domain S-box-containing protein
MKTAPYDLLPKIQLSGIFIGTALFMAVYEFLKEMFFNGTLTPWESHLITVVMTAAFATGASFFMRKWALKVDEQLRIAATAFEAQEGMLVTDAHSVTLRVNHAFTRITGYTAKEVVGRNPRLLSSGRQDASFYKAMWDSIGSTGSWEGEVWNRRKNGEIYPEYLAITAVKDPDGIVTNYVATFTDITVSRKAADEIKHLAFYDPLTHLPNRRLLLDRLKQALASSARNGRSGAILFIDLDNFKTLNDTLGHDIGDLLLQQVALRLESCVREGDTVARLGGDEFVVMLKDLSDEPVEAEAQTKVIGNKILATLNLPYQLAMHEYRNTPSIGAAIFRDHQKSHDELLKQADTAMYQSKKAGRNTLRFYDPTI